MPVYKAFGLRIDSELIIPELPISSDSRSDVRIRQGRIPAPAEVEGNYFIERRADEILFYMPDIGGVRVVGGDTIIADALPGAEERGFRFLVAGIALGLIFHQRGAVALHASAVALNSGVVAFVGWKGMGKSTTAAALHALGYSVVTDDLLVLDLLADGVGARAGFPYLKLWPDAISASTAADPDQVPKIDPNGRKRSYAAERGFVDDMLPLRHIFVLDYTEEQEQSPRIEPVAGTDACIELVRHSYILRLLRAEATPAHLERCAHVARTVPVSRLVRRRSLDRLEGIVSLVERCVEGAEEKHDRSRVEDRARPFVQA